MSGEGFVNVYRGTGKILLAPTASDYANPVASSSNTSQSQSKTSSTGTLEKAGKVFGAVTDVLDLFS